MANNDVTASLEMSDLRSTEESRPSKSCCIPKSWIIAALLFYCASLATVGLLVSFLPRRTQHITILGTPTSTSIITIDDPSICIDDECNPRLLTDIIVHNYTLEYMYNSTEQTTVQGQVTIEFTLVQPIKQLIYHSKRMLKLENPVLFEAGVYRSVLMRQYPPNDYVSLRLPNNELFAPNQYKLVQSFVISLTDSDVGFYESIFNDGNETIR
jgi:hypothetical protein